MSDFSLGQEALDASNRVLGLLAGATSQSFNQIGYGFVESQAGSSLLGGADGLNSLLGVPSSGVDERDAASSNGLNAQQKSLQDQSAQTVPFALDGDMTSLLLASSVAYQGSSNAELDEQSFWVIPAQNLANPELGDSALGGQADAANLVKGSNSLVSDFLFDLLASLSREESLESDLSGENQAAFRGFLDGLGSSLDTSARDFFQTYVQGQVKGVTAELIDRFGVDALDPVVDPLQSFDYYGTSADLIQSIRDVLSLSSVALPPIGPTAAWVRDEFLNRSAS